MPDFLTRLIARWQTMRAGRRVALVGGVLALGLLLAVWGNRQTPTYQTLYTGLSDRAGGEVIAALDTLAIPYRLDPASGAITVPEAQRHIARFRLAAQGLPRSEETNAATEAPRFGLTAQQQQQLQQDKLERDLARSILTLTAVEQARVHLALPKVSPFLREAPPATAAVLLRLRKNATLTPAQVGAIQTMVAASVPRMQRTDVKVLGPGGVLSGGGLAAADTPRAQLERELVSRVQTVLAPWLNGRPATVQVTVTLDEGDTRETREQVRTLGTGKAMPVEKTTRTTHWPQGRLARVHALVALGFDAHADERRRVEQLATQALGLIPARGDRLVVAMLPVVTAPAEATTDTATEPTVSVRAIPNIAPPVSATPTMLPVQWLGAGLAAVLALFMLWRMRARRVGDTAAQPVEDFETELGAIRAQVLADPRVAADVVKLWMRA